MSESLSLKLEQALLDVMEEHFGVTLVEMWSQVPMNDLYQVQAWLWGHHADVLAEWTRRKMEEASLSV